MKKLILKKRHKTKKMQKVNDMHQSLFTSKSCMSIFQIVYLFDVYMGLFLRKLDFVPREQWKTQTGLCMCSLISAFVIYSLEDTKAKIAISQNFNILTSLCSWEVWFDPYQVTNPEDRFSHDKAHIGVKKIQRFEKWTK